MFLNSLKEYFTQVEGVDFVLAYGSLGKGELSTYVDENSKKRVYNDIDLIIVVPNKKIFLEKSSKVHEDLKTMFETPWVDILLWDYNDLKKKRFTIFYFDLVQGHEIIYGDPQLLESYLHRFPSHKIKRFDLYKMFLTRSWALGSLYLGDDFFNQFPKGFKSYQAAKTIIATVDYELMSLGLYQSKLIDKLEIMKDIETQKTLHDLLLLAIEVKEQPLLSLLDSRLDNLEFKEKLRLNFVNSFAKNFKKLFIPLSWVISYYNLIYLASSTLRCLIARSFEPYQQALLRVRLIKEINNLDMSSPRDSLNSIQQYLTKSI